MPSSFFITKLVILLMIFLITGGLVFYFWYTIPPEGGGVVREIEARLNALRRIKERQIETSVLQGQTFKSLKPYAPPSEDGTQPGRQNPFAPL